MTQDTSNANVSMLSGVEAIKKVYERCLAQTSADFVCLSDNYQKVLGRYYDEEFAPRLKSSGVMTREVVAGEEENVTTGIHQMRYVNQASEADCIYTSEFVALISFDTAHPSVVLIEDKDLVKTLRLQFEGYWKSLN